MSDYVHDRTVLELKLSDVEHNRTILNKELSDLVPDRTITEELWSILILSDINDKKRTIFARNLVARCPGF